MVLKKERERATKN
uniref:Uncharacterized protein n=1 Tax=Rhizophora mucronata TaxID=61149 RepID=A0A2P2MLQ9_RHIMU